MAEYIARAAIVGSITSANMQAELRQMTGSEAYARILSVINCASAADVVEVVRCQYCAYFAEAKFNNKGFLICPASGMEITGMDYCSYGERKDGDDHA